MLRISVSVSSYNLTELRQGIRPFRLHWFPRLRSTSDHAAVMRRRGELFAPAVVLAGCQTAGRGRGGNAWWSGRGCLTVTFALPMEEELRPEQLALAAGLAVRNAAAELTGNDGIGLKWPNDVVYEGRKLAGLLCERIERLDLVGVGMNVNLDISSAPLPLRRRVTSLSVIAGRAVDMTRALVVVSQQLRQVLARRKNHPFAAMLEEYRKHHTLTDRAVKVTTPDGRVIEGICTGVDHLGRLVVREGERVQRIVAGHVE